MVFTTNLQLQILLLAALKLLDCLSVTGPWIHTDLTLAAWMVLLKKSTGFMTCAQNTTSKFSWTFMQWKTPKTATTTVEKLVILYGLIQLTFYIGNIKHQDGSVTGISIPKLTTISILEVSIGVSKCTKLYCNDGAPIVHFTLFNQSTSLKTSQLLEFYSLFTNSLEN